MIFSFLLFLVASRAAYLIPNDEGFENIYKSNVTLIVLFLEGENQPDYKNFTEIITKVSETQENETVLVITNKTAPHTYHSYSLSWSTLAFFKGGKPLMATPIFPSYDIISHVVRTTINKEFHTANGLSEFLGFYHIFPYTILTTSDKIEDAYRHYMAFSFSHGPFGFCVASQKLFEQIEFPKAKMAVYRLSDEYYTLFHDEESFREGLQEFVSYDIGLDQLNKREKLTFFWTSEPEEYVDISAIARKHKDHYFGYLQPEFIEKAQEFMKIVNIDEPGFAAFNFSSNFMYKPLTGKFNQQRIENYVEQVLKGKIQIIYQSEKPSDNKYGIVTKLVGENYEKYLDDDRNDDIVYYVHSYNTKLLDSIKKFADYVNSYELQGIRVAFITIDKNSCPTGFPPIYESPQIYLYPKGMHKKPVPYAGSGSIFSLLRLINNNGTARVRLDKKILKIEEELQYMTDSEYQARYLRNEKYTQLVEQNYVAFGRLLGLGNNYDQIRDQIDQMAKKIENEKMEEKSEIEDEKTMDENLMKEL
ncbi:hypothetical protein TVAG_205030 [Trichomonas vaginalis G3]|uniref:Thioredoxin domain-containing protein n=1 Tax=Trichomonas vaginalis (strain ATCC PRA-98 / G3) TaxID=412133 RepID=A2EJ05_TRIV3|nr:protein disulfide isomerase family [Trichomonas vaginalis G3]EAY07395.1 hypothetical protein TVAG_205030 [Trichomonas vaginalis G3]KAI5506548.1 protein disulfide isomerase family [Trichomonas vaginalis G3]|eukprot:XP_001319618.1 hypothetical protein [Trichomonas vaginalis G3]